MLEHAKGLAQARARCAAHCGCRRRWSRNRRCDRRSQLLRIALFERDARLEAALLGALAADREHLGVDVADGHMRVRAAASTTRKAMSPVPPARSSSRNGRRRPRRVDRGDQRVLPGAVQPAGHQVVHQVVAAGTGMEDVVDPPLLVARAGLRVRRNAFLARSVPIADCPFRAGP